MFKTLPSSAAASSAHVGTAVRPASIAAVNVIAIAFLFIMLLPPCDNCFGLIVTFQQSTNCEDTEDFLILPDF